MSSTVSLKASGLNTSPNQLELTNGSLNVASNVVIRRDDVIEPRRGFKLYGNAMPGGDAARASQLLTYKSLILRHTSNTLQWDNGSSGTFTSFAGSYSEVDSGLRIKGVESNGNFYFTTSDGIKKIAAKVVADLTSNAGYITNAGGIKALDVQGSINISQGSSSGFLPSDSAVAYRIVWGVKDINNNLILGTPSQRVEVFNPSGVLSADDLNTTLNAVDNAAAYPATPTLLSETDYLSTLGVSDTASGTELRTNVLAFATKLDADILYADDTGSSPSHLDIDTRTDHYSFDFTAINTTSNAITLTNVMSNLDQIVFTTTGTLSTDLVAGATYYALDVSGSTFKVASSFANALAGTPVDFTDQGTGTYTINIANRNKVTGGNAYVYITRGNVSDYLEVGSKITVNNLTATTGSLNGLQTVSLVAPQVVKTFVAADVDPTTDLITITNHGLSIGDLIHINNYGGALPSPIDPAKDYFVLSSGFTTNTFKIGTGPYNASFVDLNTLTGNGTNYVQTITYINYLTTATGPVTSSATTNITSGEYETITHTGSPDFPTSLEDTVVSTPATANDLATISDTLDRIIAHLKEEDASVINPTALTTFIDPLEVTSSVNVDLEFTIPDDVTVNNFYQIYRSSIVTATGPTLLSDLEPSDELQLVFEGFPTSAELTAQVVHTTDVTPDQFRGANLYTNASTGEGILQANDVPPAAKDINKFKNYTFYANTRVHHRYSIAMLGVQQLIDSYNAGAIPVITIANNNVSTSFPFATGLQEITDITVGTAASITAGTYFTLNAANNERKYYFWYRKNTAGVFSGTDPAIAGKIGVVVDIVSTDSANTVESKTRDAINTAILDFSASNNTPPKLRVTNVNEGPCTDATAGTTTFVITVIQQGRGEDLTTNTVLLSQQASVALAVDATARSLVKVINRSISAVYAYYLSGAQDVPGKILLESRLLDATNNPFYIEANNTATGSSFNPDISPGLQVNAGASIVQNGSNLEFTTSTVHNLLTGDQVLISGTKDATPPLSVDGIRTVTKINTTKFSIVATASSASVVANSIGVTYLPATQFSDNEVKPNRVYFSKLQQPEAVPLVNTIDLGAEDKAILRIFPLRDSLFVFKEDGVFRISGEVAPFSSALFDGSCILLAPDSLGLLNNMIYGWTRKGIETITESGVQSPTVSRPIDTDILPLSSSSYTNFKTVTWGIGYESDNSYIVYTLQDTTDTVAVIGYRYSNLTNSWTTFDLSTTCGVVNPADDKLYMGCGDVNSIEQERKNFDRTDYADQEFTKTLTQNNIMPNTYDLRFSSVVDFAVGDVIVQTQYLTVYEFNALLQKLDIDPGVNQNNYYSTLKASRGDNLRTKLVALANALDSDGNLTGQYADRITAGSGPYSTTISSIDVTNPATLNTPLSHGLYSLTGPFEGRYISIIGTDTNAGTTGIWETTRIDADTFSISSNVISVADGVGSFSRLEQTAADIKTCYNLIIELLNSDSGATFNNYRRNNTSTIQEAVITAVNAGTKIVSLNLALDFVVGDVTLYKSIPTDIEYAPQTMGDPLGFKQLREATVIFENKAFTSATVSFSTDLLPVLVPVDFNADSNGIFGHGVFFGASFFGGGANSAPFRTYIPSNCQRCRYLVVTFNHHIAREKYSIFGITITGETSLSSRAYR